jgi:predicted metalloprotease with PDZ domain
VAHAARDFEAGPSLDFVRLAAHELFHIWLGGFIAPPEDESLVWCHEGFTQYLAMWHAVAAGLDEPDGFAERALSPEAEARSSRTFGRVAFADPSVCWRDGNGPDETLGYKGGATLALLADVERRRAGRAGLKELVAELLRAGGPLSLAAIHDRMEALGLAEFYGRFVASPAPPPAIGAALLELGFEAADREASLTCVGIQVGDGEASRGIVAIDPEAPAARAGFEVSDRIVSCSPGRQNPPRIRDGVATPYRFGLNAIASGAAAATIEVERRGKPLSLSVAPRLIAGGVRTPYRGGSPAVERFFRVEPRGAVTR